MEYRGLKDIRKFNGMTQEELGEEIGVSGDTISKIERGERRFTAELAEKLTEVFDMHPLELRVDNLLRVTKERFEEVAYKLDTKVAYLEPGSAEKLVSVTWNRIAILTTQAASARVREGYKDSIDDKLEELYELAFELAEYVYDHADLLLSYAGGPEDQPPFN